MITRDQIIFRIQSTSLDIYIVIYIERVNSKIIHLLPYSNVSTWKLFSLFGDRIGKNGSNIGPHTC